MTAPLVPIDVDLRDFGYMPLDVLRLRDSDLAALATGEEFKAAVLLWCVAWHQVPAASLPNDDRLLARYSGAGSAWRKVKAEALRGFVECSDGRLYHATIAEKALEAWDAKAARRARTAAATAAREARLRAQHAQRDVERDDTRNVERDEPRNVDRNVHQGKGTEGNGEGKGIKETPPNPRKRGRGSVEQFPPGFESFWEAYPRKTAKPEAVKAFARLKVDDALLQRMLVAIAEQRSCEQWRKDGGQFIPHPATWLNGRRWEDRTTVGASDDIFAGAV